MTDCVDISGLAWLLGSAWLSVTMLVLARDIRRLLRATKKTDHANE